MSFIQSRIGASLASLYDVRGSIAGLEILRQEEVSVVHDMALTASSERMSAAIRRAEIGETAQSINFALVMSDFPTDPWMLHGLQVVTVDAEADFTRIGVNMRRTAPNGDFQEMPIWNWDETNSSSAILVDDDNAAAQFVLFHPVEGTKVLPLLMLGTDQPQTVQDLIIRGDTAAFGAGTVTLVVLARLSLFDPGGLNRSAHGLPVPSW